MSNRPSARHEEASIRLFENNFLEALTHVHPIVPLLFWSPVVAWLLWSSLSSHTLGAGGIALAAVAGVAVWTLSEYLLHRFLFHFNASSRIGKYLVFMFHGVHHDAPRDKSRLVMPPAGAVIVMFFLWQLFGLVVPEPWLEPFLAFFIVGYLCYDYIHYGTHHFPMRHPVLHFLKVYHLQHHHGSKGLRYGVSSPLWDHVFRTYPPEGAR
jgi:sterol desaturase/sphingolipid hydroxylase (fatty acid hydroxylase superfamily)